MAYTNVLCLYFRLSDGTFYKGQSKNIEQRLKEHSSGMVTSTKNKLPYKVIHIEICQSRTKARELEKYFKSGFGREIITEIAGVVKWHTRMV